MCSSVCINKSNVWSTRQETAVYHQVAPCYSDMLTCNKWLVLLTIHLKNAAKSGPLRSAEVLSCREKTTCQHTNISLVIIFQLLFLSFKLTRKLPTLLIVAVAQVLQLAVHLHLEISLSLHQL